MNSMNSRSELSSCFVQSERYQRWAATHYWIFNTFTAFLYWNNSHVSHVLTTSKHSKQIIKWMPLKSVMFDCIIEIHRNKCAATEYIRSSINFCWMNLIHCLKLAWAWFKFPNAFCWHFHGICQKLSIEIKKMHSEQWCIESAGQKHSSMFSFSSEFKMFD